MADVTRDGAVETPRPAAGEIPEAIVQPEWSANGTLYFLLRADRWWNVYALRWVCYIDFLATVEGEIGGPHWVFRRHYYDFLADGRVVAAIVRDGIRTAVLIADGKIAPLDIGQVHDCPRALGDGLAYIATPQAAPPSICLSPKVDGGAPVVVRAAAPAVLPEETISLGEPITFATRGGTGHAFWYPPKNREYEGPSGDLPPLVVLSHGGPTSMTTNSFSLNIQWWTSCGFAVVDVNYGGSTGYGRAYRERLYGQWGVVDVEDCAAAAKHLVERGLVDGARLVIRGGSAGGFTTLAAVATSLNLFKAGASFNGVGDLMLLAKDTHKFEFPLSRPADRTLAAGTSAL